ncbi:MAG: LPS export ABC transporter periplasmic protein LptC [Deltaproteobacteria bacterium]|nr:LPS export ABC transporter periplasmic protein LptC [Deltaproteobacteria bacterium]
MRKTRRLVLLLAVFLSLGGVAYKVYDTVSQAQRAIKKNPLKVLDYLPESALHVKDFRRAKVENGRKVWEVVGDEADFYKDQKEAVIKKPRFLYYDRDGEAAEVSGEVARMFLGEKDLEKLQIEGGIQVNYQDYILRSEEAVYIPERQRIFLPKRTTVTGRGFELEGASMEVELESQKIRMLNNVKTKFEPAKMNLKKKKSDIKRISEG